MDSSILNELRKVVGGSTSPGEITHFDMDLMMHANTYFANLTQLGVGTPGFMLQDDTQTWRDFLGDNYPPERLSQVKSYIYIKVRLVFDPPQSSAHMSTLKEEAKEIEWRLNVEVDPGMNKLEVED